MTYSVFHLEFFTSRTSIKWVCIDIANSFGHIGKTHSRFPKYMWMFDTKLNAHQIDILDSFFN